MRFTKLNYCQYLLSSQINYTLTNLAEHLEQISHDKINRYLKNEKLTPRILWDNVKDLLSWDDLELKSGKIVKIRKFPQAKKVKLFRGKSLHRQNGFYRYKRFISRFYGRCTKSV